MKKITKKEQAKLEKAKRIRELQKQEEKRLAYLNSLGLEKEVIISQSTLKDIFTDGVIKKNFPAPYDTAFNPNLSKSYQYANPDCMMKLYLMAKVIEKIKEGVRPRIKNTLKEEYKKMLLPTLLSVELSTKEEIKKPKKI